VRQPGFAEIKRRVRRLLFRYRMIQPDDRIAVGLSGGKDSSFLLYLLNEFRHEFRWKFDLAAYRVIDPESPCHNIDGLDDCKTWCARLSVPLKVISPLKQDDAYEGKTASPCFKCAWRRKELLFRTITNDGYTTLALGHTAFDLAVTAMMNMMYHGNLETIPPVMEFFSGKIKVIRPISNITEDQVIRHHKRLKLPPPPPACHDYVGVARSNSEKRVRSMCEENPRALKNILTAAKRWPSDVLGEDQKVNPQ